MDENQYHQTYREFNHQPCLFARAILRRCVGCSRAQRLYLAEREAVGCLSPAGQLRCQHVTQQLQQKARFALRLRADAPLPFGKQMQLQCGGMQGLAEQLQQGGDPNATASDLYTLLNHAEQQWSSLDALPFTELMPHIVHFRPRTQRRNSDN